MKRTVILWTLLALLAVPAWSQTTKNIPERHPVLSQDEILANIGPTAEVVKVIKPIFNFKAGKE